MNEDGASGELSLGKSLHYWVLDLEWRTTTVHCRTANRSNGKEGG
jgi:hypothetical protein